jgi:hypothetical protein
MKRVATPEHVANVQALVNHLAEQLRGADAQVALDALLATYRCLAMNQPAEQTQHAGDMATHVGIDLGLMAAGLLMHTDSVAH